MSPFMFYPAQHARLNTLNFRPPKPNLWVQGIFKWLFPVLLKTLFGRLSVEISPESLEKLKAIRGQRCLILPNHPSEWDPCVLFDVSHQLNEHFFNISTAR